MGDFERELRRHKAEQESLEAASLRALEESFQQRLAIAALVEKQKQEKRAQEYADLIAPVKDMVESLGADLANTTWGRNNWEKHFVQFDDIEGSSLGFVIGERRFQPKDGFRVAMWHFSTKPKILSKHSYSMPYSKRIDYGPETSDYSYSFSLIKLDEGGKVYCIEDPGPKLRSNSTTQDDLKKLLKELYVRGPMYHVHNPVPFDNRPGL